VIENHIIEQISELDYLKYEISNIRTRIKRNNQIQLNRINGIVKRILKK
jgi:hypothetical protein